MPQVAVTERTVSPKFDFGLITGLIAGGIVSLWMLVVGGLGAGTAADHGVIVSALVLGDGAFNEVGFNGNWIVGQVVHLAIFALLGIVFAAVWPRIRQYGTLTPAVLFWFAAYFVVVQLIGRLLEPEMAGRLGISLLIGYLIAGFVFAIRYRRA